jgi:hypothetical protein
MDDLFRAIVRDLHDLDRFVRSQRYVLRCCSRGVQRSGFEIGFWVVTTDPEFWHRMLLSTPAPNGRTQAGPALCVLGRLV